VKVFFLNLAKTLQFEKIEFRQLKRENIIENKNPTLEFELPVKDSKKRKMPNLNFDKYALRQFSQEICILILGPPK